MMRLPLACLALAGSAAWAGVAQPAEPQTVKAVILTRSLAFSLDRHGLIESWRNTLEPFQIVEIREGLAAGTSFGASRRPLIVEQDDEPVVEFLESPASPYAVGNEGTFASARLQTWWQDPVASSVNRFPFQAEDKVDRGPYGRLMMIHGGLRGPVGG
ncbi:MAG: hypothetical protein MH204_02430, partial [Fimbriimonadaceae bacterium]|nr:hypothetical protein [Fimbriimonadaceae bacterium]